MWLLIPIILIVIIIYLSKHSSSQMTGNVSENQVSSQIFGNLDPEKYSLIENITLPTWNNRTTQIDHIVVSKYGVFVIETKTLNGWIFGSENSSKWTKVYFHSKYYFMNPLHQNYKHLMTLHEQIGIPKSKLHSIVVFVGDTQFKTSMPANVIKDNQLIEYIARFSDHILSDGEVKRINFEIGAKRLEQSKVTDREHIENLHWEKKIKEKQFYWNASDQRVPYCPRCGNKMILKTDQYSNNKFWGCSNFPKCKQIIKIVNNKY